MYENKSNHQIFVNNASMKLTCHKYLVKEPKFFCVQVDGTEQNRRHCMVFLNGLENRTNLTGELFSFLI
jgi:hypothetical protein